MPNYACMQQIIEEYCKCISKGRMWGNISKQGFVVCWLSNCNLAGLLIIILIPCRDSWSSFWHLAGTADHHFDNLLGLLIIILTPCWDCLSSFWHLAGTAGHHFVTLHGLLNIILTPFWDCWSSFWHLAGTADHLVFQCEIDGLGNIVRTASVSPWVT